MLFNAGDHAPVIPLFEEVGSGLNASPLHITATCVKVGVIEGVFTVMVNEVMFAHCPVFGVNV